MGNLEMKYLFDKLKFYLDYIEIIKDHLQNAPDPVVLTTSDLKEPGPTILWANKSFLIATEYSLEELIGRSPRVLQGELTNRKMLDELKENLTNGKIFSGETINYTKGREPYKVQIIITPLFDLYGNLSNYLGIHKVIK
jgi:two-component system OmpR family sensor kinase